MSVNRRDFLGLAALAPVAGLAASRAFAEDAACYDPASLPMSQQNFRKSMQFQQVSTDPKKRCELCTFYKASKPGCGTCQIFNGPVQGVSVCASFAPKAA